MDHQITESKEPLQPSSPNALKVAATECLNSWINFLQTLNSTCTAGLLLSQSLGTLSQAPNISLADQCLASWEELTKATMVASHTVKSHIAATMQDLVIGETFSEYDAQRQCEHNQQIITENLLTFINLQYQFSIASCECFGAIATCPSCQTTPGGSHDPECSMAVLQQCFARLYMQESHSQMSSPPYLATDSPKNQEIRTQHSESFNPEARGSSPYSDSHRGPSPIYAFIDSIRGPGHIETIRGPFPNPGQLHTMKHPFLSRGSRSFLHFPLFPLSGQRRWSEAAAREMTDESDDGMMRRWSMPWDCARVESAPWQHRYLSRLVPAASQDQTATPETAPGGTLPSGDGLAEAIQLLSCRPMRCAVPPGPSQPLESWNETLEERMFSKKTPGSSQRGQWHSVDVPQPSGASFGDLFPPVLSLNARKSSSSTDSSSCLSVHSRSTTGSSDRGSDNANSGGDSVRFHTNFYSFWSGNDHLPFLRLPESQEPIDDSDTDKSIQLSFPKPT